MLSNKYFFINSLVMLQHKSTSHESSKGTESHNGACDKYNKAMQTIFEDEVQRNQSMVEITKDDTFISLLGILNDLTKQEISVCYLIFKEMMRANNKLIKIYLNNHFNMILTEIFNNLNCIHDNYVIIIVGKQIRKLIKNKTYIDQVLNFDLLQKLFKYSESENFMLSKECLKVISYIFESPKVDSEIVSEFLSKNEKDVSALFTEHFLISESDQSKKDRYYYLQRESLRLLETIFRNKSFDSFTKKASNNLQNLKTTMILLNNQSNKIMIQAIYILAFFFNDMEYKSQKIKETLFTNKQNFEMFFSSHNGLTEIEETKNCILYELERLSNMVEQ